MTESRRWKSRWVTPKSKPFNSKIHGMGLQAIAPIARGEFVAILGGIIVPSEDFNDYEKTMGNLGIQLNDGFYICPPDREELYKTGVLNHSCEPNLGLIDSITFVAIKDIKVGDELTFDYAIAETRGSSFDCNCNSARCRKIINPTDWELPYLQEKYSEFFSPYIKSKIKSRTDQ